MGSESEKSVCEVYTWTWQKEDISERERTHFPRTGLAWDRWEVWGNGSESGMVLNITAEEGWRRDSTYWVTTEEGKGGDCGKDPSQLHFLVTGADD